MRDPRASSSRWSKNSPDAFTAFGETGGALASVVEEQRQSRPWRGDAKPSSPARIGQGARVPRNANRIETPIQNTETQMRKLKIIEHISLGGVIQVSGDDGDFRKAFIITKVVDARVGA